VSQPYTLIQISVEVLGTEEGAVKSAFAWLESEQQEDKPVSEERDQPAAAETAGQQ